MQFQANNEYNRYVSRMEKVRTKLLFCPCLWCHSFPWLCVFFMKRICAGFLIFCIYLYYCRRSPIIKKGGWVGIPRNWFNSPTFFISTSRCGILTMDITDDPVNIGLSFHYLFFTSPQLLLHFIPLISRHMNIWNWALWINEIILILSEFYGWDVSVKSFPISRGENCGHALSVYYHPDLY